MLRSHSHSSMRGFTMTEMLVVIGVIILLMGLLLPALAGVRTSGLMTKSMARMRQIGTWMTLYSTDNRDTVLPSQFEYAGLSYPGKVRSDPNPPTSSAVFGSPTGEGCGENCGTWSDILWTLYVNKPILDEAGRLNGYDYRYDSPDVVLHRLMPGLDDPFRSAAPNTRDVRLSAAGGPTAGGGGKHGPKPFFDGAQESGLPGYFAANDYFATAGNWSASLGNAGWPSMGQVTMPEQSMYLVDSFAGEVIDPTEEAFQAVDTSTNPVRAGTGEVDFRYNDSCLMLFLDSHVDAVGHWNEICDLEGTEEGRSIKVRNLQSRAPACP